MTTLEVQRQAIQIDRRLLVSGAVLLGIGGLCGAAGMLLGTYALISATRQWVNQQETPPNEIVRRRLQQAKVAGAAAADAWRRNTKSLDAPTSD